MTQLSTQRIENEVSLRELLLLIQRRRMLLLACMFLGGLVGIGLLSVIRPIYVASAFVLIEPDKRSASDVTVASASDTLDSAALDSQVQILASRSLAREVIDALDLDEASELTQPTGVAADLMARVLPVSVAAPAAAERPRDVVGRFLSNLVVRREGKSHVIAISYRSHDPAQAAAVANKLAELYMLAQRVRKQEAARRQSGWLSGRLAQLKGELEDAERALVAFRDTGASKGGALRVAGDELARIGGELVVASVARSTKEASLARLRRQLERGERLDVADAQLGSSPLLEALSNQKAELLKREAELAALYGERHPKIQAVAAEKEKLDARIAQERRALLRAFEGAVEQARAREASLAAKLEELKGEAIRRENAAQRVQELEHEVEVKRRLYETHLTRAQADDRPAETLGADARVISEAVPPGDPSFPDARLVLSLSLTSGLLLGLAALYVAESGEPRFRSAGDIEAALGLPALALVPRLDGGRLNGSTPQDYVLERPRSRYAEALRALLAGLLRPRTPGVEGPRVVLVTSSLPREGKSTLVASLARIAAGEGLRVIVIDGDLRKPKLHELLGLEQGPGLVEVLRREVPLADALIKDKRAPLRLLPGSERLTQPTRLLGPEGLGTLLTALKRNFDLVLVDSAPLAAVADAKLLAGLVDSVLWVVRYGDTRRDFCRTCLKDLEEAGATLAGAVLSQVDLRDHERRYGGKSGAGGARLGDYYAD